jgi:hypothetical protein
MDFPLVPVGSLNVSVRERFDQVPQPAPGFTPTSWTTPNSAILLRTYKPAAKPFFFGSEYLEGLESVGQPVPTSKWGDSAPQTARISYQKTAANQKLNKHIIDLYI